MNHNVLDTYDLSDCQFEDGQRCFGGLESDSETLVLIVGSKAVPAMLMPYTISITEQMKPANLPSRPGLIHLSFYAQMTYNPSRPGMYPGHIICPLNNIYIFIVDCASVLPFSFHHATMYA